MFRHAFRSPEKPDFKTDRIYVSRILAQLASCVVPARRVAANQGESRRVLVTTRGICLAMRPGRSWRVVRVGYSMGAEWI